MGLPRVPLQNWATFIFLSYTLPNPTSLVRSHADFTPYSILFNSVYLYRATCCLLLFMFFLHNEIVKPCAQKDDILISSIHHKNSQNSFPSTVLQGDFKDSLMKRWLYSSLLWGRVCPVTCFDQCTLANAEAETWCWDYHHRNESGLMQLSNC